MTQFKLTVSLIALTATPALAQDAFELDPITLYGSLTATPLSETGATIHVIEEEDLEQAATGTLQEIVSQTPGVTFTQNGGAAGTSFVRIRGLSQYYAPVLFNGINITDPSSIQNQLDWANILGGGLSRAEIIKGSQSAIHGSDAIAGVIALEGAVAPDAPGREGSLTIEAGAYNTKKAALSYGFANDKVGVAFSLARQTTDGFSAVNAAGYDEDDGFDGTQASIDAYINLTDTIRVGATAFHFDSEGEYDPTFGNVEDGDTKATQKGYRFYADAQTGIVDHTFDYSFFQVDRTLTNTFGSTDYEGTREKLGYKASVDVNDAVALTFGLDQITETAEAAPEDVTVKGLFGEVQYAATSDIDLSLSLRRDEHSEFGIFNAARLAGAWQATDSLTFRASLSNGYRAPSLYEIANAFDPDEFVDPFYNPSSNGALEADGLNPEKSISFDLSVEKTYAGGTSITATAFYSEITDRITYDDPDGYDFALPTLKGGYMQDSGVSVTKGIELAASTFISPNIELSGAYTYTDARNAEDDPLQRIPRYALALAVDAQITDKLRLGATLEHQADIPDTSNATFTSQDKVEDFTVVNASAAYAFNDVVEGYVRVENLFDEQYERIPEYNTSDRAAYFGIRAKF